MADLTTMRPLEAIRWYDKHGGYDLDVSVIEQCLSLGITDTEQIVEFGEMHPDLDAVPDMPVTMANLRLLAKVGPQVMNEDRENAEEWAAVFGAAEDEESWETIDAFLKAGRGPSYARQLMAVLKRIEEEDRYSVTDVTDLDLSLSVPDLTVLLEAGMSGHEQERWAALGVPVDQALVVREKVSVATAEALGQHGVRDLEGWLKYAPIPLEWLGHGNRRPEEFTLDVLLEFAEAGYATKGERQYPWAAPFTSGANRHHSALTISLERARACAEAGMQPSHVGRYYEESKPPMRTVDNAPPPFISRYDVVINDETFAAWVRLWRAGVKPGALIDYRWGGAHTFDQVLQAVEAGIDAKRVKYLRATYGKSAWRGHPSRIKDFERLLAAHQEDLAKAEQEAVNG